MNNLFFYHDDGYKQNWLCRKITKLPENFSFGGFCKEKYPFGFQSAFIFVDHCDFDTPQKVEAVFYGTSDKNSKIYGKKGILGSGLTATKTVFVDARGTENIGLENRAYKELIEKLYHAGVEIAAHSLQSKLSLKRTDPRLEKDLDMMQRFETKTWVDHDYLLHNITRQGWNRKSSYYILDKLLKKGYLFFWSKIDHSLNAPDGNLNLFNPKGRAGKDYLGKVFRLIRQREKVGKIAFVFFWDFIGNLLGWQAKDDLILTINTIGAILRKSQGKSPALFKHRFGFITRTMVNFFNPLFYFQMGKNFFFPDKTNSFSASCFYPVEFENGETLYFFNSLWINDFVGCYAPPNIDRLVQEGGLHIGHNYFSAQEKHYLSSSVEKVGQHYEIADGFQKNLEHLACRQKERKIWVTTLLEFGQYFLKWQKVKIEAISSSKLFVKNTLNDKIAGLTISKEILQNENPKVKFDRHKRWNSLKRGKNVVVWFDLEPKEELMLEVS